MQTPSPRAVSDSRALPTSARRPVRQTRRTLTGYSVGARSSTRIAVRRRRPAARRASWRPVRPGIVPRPMGETPKITDPVEALAAARASFEDGDDFTVGVEEEFAILDRERLNMTAGFERFDAAARTGPLAGMVAGELIR